MKTARAAEFTAKAAALQQMLYPSERKLLAALPAASPTVAANQSKSESVKPTQESHNEKIKQAVLGIAVAGLALTGSTVRLPVTWTRR